MIEEVEDKEPYAVVTIRMYDEGEHHIPVMDIDFDPDTFNDLDISHIISIRDSAALFIHKIEKMIDIANRTVIADE